VIYNNIYSMDTKFYACAWRNIVYTQQ
jgi:hypothetical protein